MGELPFAWDDECHRCGHIRDAHRLDDATNVSPTDPAAKFRCLGTATLTDRQPASGRPLEFGYDCDCPDWVEP